MKQKLLTLFAALLTLATTTANAANEVLYATVSGSTMTINCGNSAPSGSYKFTAYYGFDGITKGNITTVNITCINYTGGNLANIFQNYTKLEKVTGLSYLLTSNTTDTSCMFDGCSNLASLDFTSCNTENVTNMASMFLNCYALTSLDVTMFNTAKVTYMSNMFYGCSKLTTLNLSSFDTSNVTTMSNMFNGCSKLTTLNLSSFDTSNVTTMSNMFNGCSKLTTLNLSSFDTSNVTDMSAMFYNCNALPSIDVSNFNTANVTDMTSMFYNCKALTTLNVSNFNTANVTDMKSMFHLCNALTSLDVSNFNTANVTTMSSMFNNCSVLKAIIIDDSKWSTSAVTKSDGMFTNCSALVGEDGTKVGSTVDVTYANTGDGGYLTKKSVSVSAAEIDGDHWATYYKSTVNRKADAATTVYAATRSGSELTLVSVTDGIIKAGQGVILKSTASSVTLTTVTDAADDDKYADNALSGVDKATAQDGTKTYYVLSDENSTLGFYKYKSTGLLGAHKAFLEVTGSLRAPAMFDLNIGDSTDDSTTAVSSTELKSSANATYYTLDGRRLAARPTRKGIYIIGGKTIIIK